jgi:uncharacterized protein
MYSMYLLFFGLLFAGPLTGASLPWLGLLLLALFLLRWSFSAVHPQRLFTFKGPQPVDFHLEAEEVVVKSRDGFLLSAWYIRGSRPAAIILAHGLAGDKDFTAFHAASLAPSGYHLLLLDLRAHGRSQGELSTMGVNEANDILGALDFLRIQPEIDPQQIGALGISMGAQAVIRAAARDQGIRAMVLEGLGPRNIEDHPEEPRTWIRQLYMPLNFLMYAMVNWFAGIPEPEGTTFILRRLRRPVLLISTGKKAGQVFNREFKIAAGRQAVLWELPNAPHAAAFFVDKKGYVSRMLALFEAAFSNGKAPVEAPITSQSTGPEGKDLQHAGDL